MYDNKRRGMSMDMTQFKKRSRKLIPKFRQAIITGSRGQWTIFTKGNPVSGLAPQNVADRICFRIH